MEDKAEERKEEPVQLRPVKSDEEAKLVPDQVVEIDAMDVLLDVGARQNLTDKVTLHRKGVAFDIQFRPIDSETYERFQEACTTKVVQRRLNTSRTEIDFRRLRRMVVFECVVKPDLHDAKFFETYKLQKGAAEEIVPLVLLPGEIDNVADKIMTLSGYEDDLVEVAKS